MKDSGLPDQMQFGSREAGINAQESTPKTSAAIDAQRPAEGPNAVAVALITRFFFDIDEPISDFGGAVHAYVGDEVIVTWPVTDDPARNARCLAGFFAIEHKIASLTPDYEAKFGVVPAFRAAIHAGTVVVSECGDAKRQLAYFGDTMNVAARLCEYCKTINRRLVVSGELLQLISVPDALEVGVAKSVAARGRQEQVEAHVVEPRPARPDLGANAASPDARIRRESCRR